MMLSATIIPEHTPIVAQHLATPYKNEPLTKENSDFGLYI